MIMRVPTLLTSYGFLTALAVLVVNDHLLKPLLPGVVTGKLSDFAGLFAFPLFWSAFAPRHRPAIHVATAGGFIWWKMPWSQSLIDTINAWSPVAIGRTVDDSDFIALVAVPLAYWYCKRPRRQVARPMLRMAVVPIALIAFTATTFPRLTAHERVYQFRASPHDLRQALGLLEIEEWVPPDSTLAPAPPDGIGPLDIVIPTDCCGSVVVFLYVDSDSVGSSARVRAMVVGGSLARGDSGRLIEIFERCFVQRMDSVITSGRAWRDVAVRHPPGAPGSVSCHR